MKNILKNFFTNVLINSTIKNQLLFFKFIILINNRKKILFDLFSLFKTRKIKSYLDFNRRRIKNKKKYYKNIILIDIFPVAQWIIANSIFTNTLAEKLKATIKSFSLYSISSEIHDIYSSWGCNHNYLIRLNLKQKKKLFIIYQKLLKEIKNTDDLINFKLNNIWIGLDIYETILRKGVATVVLNSFNTRYAFFLGSLYYVYFDDLFSRGEIKAVVLSHDVYINMGTISKIAQAYDVPVYYVNPREFVKSFDVHDISQKFKNYKVYFNRLNSDKQKLLIERAKKSISKRIKGNLKIDISYQEKSAFIDKKIKRQTNNNDKLKILIATHCFFDNPHAYSFMMFKDFYHWLIHLGEISKKVNYEWYIKTHRDYLPGTIEIINKIISKYPNIKLVNPETSFHQLFNEGCKIALTCYGSIGHELPLIGYTVINNSLNPHSSFNFNYHIYNIDEYTNTLLNLENINFPNHIEDIYKFYAIHNYIIYSDSYLFKSFQKYTEEINYDFSSYKAYHYFMKDPENNLKRFRNNCEKFLVSKYRYLFEEEII